MGWLSWKQKPDPICPDVLMYTRSGCHLCDEARDLLDDLRKRYRFELTMIDVDSESHLAEQYGVRVPVIVVGGKERMWGRINRVLLERLFLGATGQDQ